MILIVNAQFDLSRVVGQNGRSEGHQKSSFPNRVSIFGVSAASNLSSNSNLCPGRRTEDFLTIAFLCKDRTFRDGDV